jgi:hypothetical protein
MGGEELTEMAELAESGAVGFSDDGLPIRSARVLRRRFSTSASPVPTPCTRRARASRRREYVGERRPRVRDRGIRLGVDMTHATRKAVAHEGLCITAAVISAAEPADAARAARPTVPYQCRGDLTTSARPD